MKTPLFQWSLEPQTLISFGKNASFECDDEDCPCATNSCLLMDSPGEGMQKAKAEGIVEGGRTIGAVQVRS
jgi:hypothetical protein